MVRRQLSPWPGGARPSHGISRLCRWAYTTETLSLRIQTPGLHMKSQSRAVLEPSTTVTPSPEVLVQELDGEAVILNLDSERYFGLDDVGTRIWTHLLEHRRVDRVCEEMQKEYDVEESRLRADIVQLVEDLIDAGIVSIEANAPNGT
jgi:hypothetical protein